MASSLSFNLTCLCGSISEPGTLLSDKGLPAESEICHCNSCRYATGSLGASFPGLNSAPSEKSLSRLTPYHSSDKLTRYFCSRCGCHCFVAVHSRGSWCCLGGMLERNSDESGSEKNVVLKDTVKVLTHEYDNLPQD